MKYRLIMNDIQYSTGEMDYDNSWSIYKLKRFIENILDKVAHETIGLIYHDDGIYAVCIFDEVEMFVNLKSIKVKGFVRLYWSDGKDLDKRLMDFVAEK